ncbi:MAG: hypothetical protein M3134_00815 [Actinomycetota bacterium]|nr:hypothetical protein [Actinomycetota bacterium]
MADRLELATFEPLVGETFVADVEGLGPVDLTLAEAAPSPWQPGPETGLPHAFHLVFRSSADYLLDQRMYRMKHGELGDLEIFMTPIARTAEGTDYQAVFS